MDDAKKVLVLVNGMQPHELNELEAMLRQSTQPLDIHLLYVKPTLPSCYFHMPSMVNMAKQSEQRAVNALQSTGQRLNVTKDHLWIATGNIRHHAMTVGKKLQTSLILASETEQKKLTAHFGLRRQPQGCSVETISGFKTSSCSPSPMAQNSKM